MRISDWSSDVCSSDELLHCQEQTTCLMSATFQGVSGPRGMSLSEHRPVVGIIMGSTSDWETMSHADETQSALQVPPEVKVVYEHRTPQRPSESGGSPVQRGQKTKNKGRKGT